MDDIGNVVLINEITSQLGRTVFFTEDCTLGVNTLVLSSIQIYPNPSSSFITVENSQPFEKILIYNMQGELIKSYLTTSMSQTLNISDFQTGLYLLKIIGKETTTTKKIIKN